MINTNSINNNNEHHTNNDNNSDTVIRANYYTPENTMIPLEHVTVNYDIL